MSDCRIEVSGLEFSAEKAKSRLARASRILGEKVVKRLLAFALFLLGAEREAIAASLGLPLGTLLSLLTRIGKVGLAAFEDRRCRHSEFRPVGDTAVPAPTVTLAGEQTVIGLDRLGQLRIPSADTLQIRVVLLTLVNSRLLPTQVAADGLGCTAAHVRTLCRKLDASGAEALLDRRCGQQRDYRMTPEVKSELIAQTAAHALTGYATSSVAVAESLNERLGWQLADRTVRLHMQRLGLAAIGESLPALVEALKKNSTAS